MKAFKLSSDENQALSRDEQFLKELEEVIESNLEKESFGVKELSEAMTISRIGIYRRLKRLTGKSINQYLREYRLERAMELLKKDVAGVSEIAYQVGFNSPAYFNKCFRDLYGYPPGEVIKKHHEIVNFGGGEKEKLMDDQKYQIPFKRPFRYLFYITCITAIVITGYYSFTWMNNTDALPDHLERKTLTVLPFRNDSPNPENEFICTNMQEEIINRMRKIQSILIRPVQSIEQYQDSHAGMVAIAKEFNVDYLLDGTLVQFGDTIRLWIKLIDTNRDVQVWEEAYMIPFETEAVYDFQSRIAGKVVASMGEVITTVEQNRITDRYKPKTEALQFYWQAQQEHWNYRQNWKWDPIHLEHAKYLINQALTLDPEFPDALAFKGSVIGIMYPDSALYYLEKAIELDPENVMAYGALAQYYLNRGEEDLSLRYYKKVIELEPNAAWNYARMGEIYVLARNDLHNGLPYLKKALKLDSITSNVMGIMGRIYLFIGDYQKAEKYLLKEIKYGTIHPCVNLNFYCLSLRAQNKLDEGLQFLDTICHRINCRERCQINTYRFLIFQGNFEEAASIYDQLIREGIKIHLNDSIFLAHMYKQLGRNEAYQEVIDHCRKRYEEALGDEDEQNLWTYHNIPWVYAQLGEREKMIKYLIKKEKQGFYLGTHDVIQNSSIFEPYRNDPELRALLQRVHEKKAGLRAEAREIEERL